MLDIVRTFAQMAVRASSLRHLFDAKPTEMTEGELIGKLLGKTVDEIRAITGLAPTTVFAGVAAKQLCPRSRAGKPMMAVDEYYQWDDLFGWRVGVFVKDGMAIDIQISEAGRPVG